MHFDCPEFCPLFRGIARFCLPFSVRETTCPHVTGDTVSQFSAANLVAPNHVSSNKDAHHDWRFVSQIISYEPLMRRMILTFLACLPMPAWAGTPLWQNLEEGMTVEQVRVLYPAAEQRRNRLDIKNYRPLPNCPSTVRVLFEAGRLHAIQVRGAPSILGLCATEIEGALRARYGEPVDRDYEAPTLLTNATVSYLWVHAGVVMRYQMVNDQNWIMEYVSVARLEREREERARIGL